MRRRASSLAFFLCGFLVAVAVIQVSHAQTKTAPTSSRDGSLVIDPYSQFVFTVQGNRMFRVPVSAFEQKNVTSVVLK